MLFELQLKELLLGLVFFCLLDEFFIDDFAMLVFVLEELEFCFFEEEVFFLGVECLFEFCFSFEELLDSFAMTVSLLVNHLHLLFDYI